MQSVRHYVAIALVSLAAFVFVGLPVLSLCTVVHGVMLFQWSLAHIVASLHIGTLLLLAYYFHDFFDGPGR